tara:strand:+ start:1677 stop:1934 length:258 start_codon:yes stop_codon:yes gene_type:complete
MNDFGDVRAYELRVMAHLRMIAGVEFPGYIFRPYSDNAYEYQMLYRHLSGGKLLAAAVRTRRTSEEFFQANCIRGGDEYQAFDFL